MPGNNKDIFKIETNLEVEIEKSSGSENEHYKISGIASSYGNIDSYGDIFKEGSLDEEIGKTVPIKVDHNYSLDSIIGKAVFSKQGKLIKFEGDLLKGDPLAEKVALMKASGIPLKVSIGGRILTSKWIKQNEKDVRVIEKATAHEISIVTKGANPLAVVQKSEKNTEDRNMDEILEILKAMTIKLEDFGKSSQNKEEYKKAQNDLESQLKEIKKTIEEKSGNEELNEIKKQISALDEMFKSKQLGDVKEVKKDFNKEFKRSIIAKSETDFMKNYGNVVVDEFKKADVGFSDVSAITEVPIDNDMIISIGEISPLFGDAGKTSWKGESTTIPIRKKQPNNVSDVGLYEGTNGTKIAYDFKMLSKGVMQTEYLVPDELVADTKFDIMSDLYQAASDDFSETLAEKILNGVLDPVNYQGNKFEGIQKNTEFMTTRTVEQKVSASLDWKEIQSIIRKIPSGKRKGMAFYCSPEACDLMETMVDANNRPLWRDSITNGTPSTFLSYPVKEVYNMGAKTGDMLIMFANMKDLYRVGLDYDMNLETERKATNRATNTIINSRMGGIVRDIECGYAIKKKAPAKK